MRSIIVFLAAISAWTGNLPAQTTILSLNASGETTYLETEDSLFYINVRKRKISQYYDPVNIMEVFDTAAIFQCKKNYSSYRPINIFSFENQQVWTCLQPYYEPSFLVRTQMLDNNCMYLGQMDSSFHSSNQYMGDSLFWSGIKVVHFPDFAESYVPFDPPITDYRVFYYKPENVFHAIRSDQNNFYFREYDRTGTLLDAWSASGLSIQEYPNFRRNPVNGDWLVSHQYDAPTTLISSSGTPVKTFPVNANKILITDAGYFTFAMANGATDSTRITVGKYDLAGEFKWFKSIGIDSVSKPDEYHMARITPHGKILVCIETNKTPYLSAGGAVYNGDAKLLVTDLNFPGFWSGQVPVIPLDSSENKLLLYPNPVRIDEPIHIANLNQPEETGIRIVDPVGRMVWEGKPESDLILFHNRRGGLYFVQVSSTDGRKVLKLRVQ